jgi:hypothetical protein
MSGHEHHHEPTPAEAIRAGHELSDAEAAPVLKFLAFLAVVTVSVAAIVVVFYNYLESREAREKTARYPMAAGSARPLPPPPRLQTYPFQDVKDLRQEERRLLETYEWVDRSAGVVRIPVERAIEVLAAKGLPYRQPGATAPAASDATATAGPAAGAPAASGAATPKH